MTETTARTHATARVQLTLEVDVRSVWGAECALSQIYEQASNDARDAVGVLIAGSAGMRIVGVQKIEAIIVTREGA
jgi:hypothetical protein